MALQPNTATCGKKVTNIELLAPGFGKSITIAAKPGQKLSIAIWLSGRFSPILLCNGLGLCAHCRCRFFDNAPTPVANELRHFNEAEIAAGWRLACNHTVPNQPYLKLELPYLKLASHTGTIASQSKDFTNAFLGFDLGTTSIQWQAVNAENALLATGSLWNPQSGAGADVVSRIQIAIEPEGRKQLAQLVHATVQDTLVELASQNINIIRACIAANTAMTEIFLQKDVSGLAVAPYHTSFAGGEIVEIHFDNACPPLTTIIPPLPGPFVGGDISTGLLALLELRNATPPFLLADLGTNAELALLDDAYRLWLASAPLGPAMEGIGPQCGQPVGPGVITTFSTAPSGIIAQIPFPASQVAGISATGYISLLAILFKLGMISANGNLQANTAMTLTTRISRDLAAGRLILPHNQFIDDFDIELLLKIKATLAVAIRQLFAAANLAPSQLGRLYLAGALGQYASIDDLAVLGFIPMSLASKTTACGNTSLAGACLLAVQPHKLSRITKLCSNAKIIDLANDTQYLQNYLQAMHWGQ